MNQTPHLFKFLAFSVLLILFSQCKKNTPAVFSAQMLEGDWVPADTTKFHHVANNLFTALSFYNNKGGIPDTSYFVRADSIFVKSSGPVRNGKKVRPDHWRYWRRIHAIRNDTIFLFRHSLDTMLILVKAKITGTGLKLQRMLFHVSTKQPSPASVYDNFEICRDTVFGSKNASGEEKVYYCSGSAIQAYFQDKIQRINWSKTDTSFTAATPQTDNITLVVETNAWKRTFCCYQNFREPVFNQMIRQLDQFPGMLDWKELGKTHSFAVREELPRKQ